MIRGAQINIAATGLRPTDDDTVDPGGITPDPLAGFEFFFGFGEAFQNSNQLVATGGWAALAAAVALSVVLAALMLGLAMDQRWLGLDATAKSELDLAWVEDVDPDGPSRRIAPSSRLVAITGADRERIEIGPEDLIEEPDALPTDEAMRVFFDRQDVIAEAMRRNPVVIETEFLSEPRLVEVSPARQRPVTSLPPAFWMQIGVGLAGFWIGAWIWALRRGEWATRCLAITGAGLMISAFPAAVYSTRELAIPGGLFSILSKFNHFGALTFGVGMIGLFLVYPRKLVSHRWLALPAVIFGALLVVDFLQLAGGPGLGFHLSVVVAMLAIVILVGFQFRATRGDPRDRAALTWLGLAVIVGAGAFVVTVIAPNVLGIEALVSQAQAFLFFLLIYVVGVLLLLVLDAILIVTIIDERAPAFALSLLIVALVWLPLRDTLARAALRRREPFRRNLFRQVMDVALTPPGRDQHARWLSPSGGRLSPAVGLARRGGAGPGSAR